jgi:uncharacterized delta-60 repeat protein
MKHAFVKNINGCLAITLVVLVIAFILAGCPNPTTGAETPTEVATPIFSLDAGTYGHDLLVTIDCSTPEATIYYTTDGNDPSSSSAAYSSAISVEEDGTSMTIKAIAMKSGISDSAVAEASYTIHYSGTLDTGFLATGSGANNVVGSIAVQSEGKILIGGAFTTFNGTNRGYVARLNVDGSLDTGFLAAGDGANNGVQSIAVQSDGKILIGGGFTTYNGTNRGYVARLNADGSLDTGFLATGDGANSGVYSIAVQSDGKILIGGGFTTYNGTNRGYVARLNADGSLDVGFLATGDGANSGVYSVAEQIDSKILIGGYFTTYNATNRGHVARLNADGSLDASFLANGTGTNNPVFSVAVQSDGKILIGGGFYICNGTGRGYVARLKANGSLDTSFHATGIGANDWVYSVAVQSDGKILIGGIFASYSGTSRGYIARLWN